MNNRIDNKPAMHYANTRSLGESSASKANAGVSRSAQADQSDRLSLSARADRLQSLIAKAQAEPEVNQARVDALKNAISQGNYAIDADSLAARMMGSEAQMGEPVAELSE